MRLGWSSVRAAALQLVFYSSVITMMHGPINIIFIISLSVLLRMRNISDRSYTEN